MSITSLADEEIVRTDRTSLYPQLRPLVDRHLDSKMFASTVAFMVWALAIPTTPYLEGESGKVPGLPHFSSRHS